MTYRLPEVFLSNFNLSVQPFTRKKQGGIFQLNLNQKDCLQMSPTFTSQMGHRNNKTSTVRRIGITSRSLYKTLPLSVNRYQVSKQKRLLNSGMSALRSVKLRSFSLQKGPQTCCSFQDNEQADNINSLLSSSKQQLVQLDLKVTPFRFVAGQYRHKLAEMQTKIQNQINLIDSDFTKAIQSLKSQISDLRKQTGGQIKRYKMDFQNINSELKVYRQMAQDFHQKMENIKNNF